MNPSTLPGVVTWSAVLMIVAITAGWIVFFISFLSIRKTGPTEGRKRDTASVKGLVLQFVGLGIVWTARRPLVHGTTGLAAAVGVASLVITILLVASSVWMVREAVRTLGKQWSLTARVVEGHELIIEGPYRIVRHPIYTGLMGMLIATGLALSYWWAIPLGLVAYVVGTMIRIRSEEKLLREMFGARFENFVKRVPALIPAITRANSEAP